MPISEIEIGDTVIAYDEETGETGEYTVTDTISHEDESIAYVTISGEEIETTPWHLFYTSEGWKEAEDLQEGDSIVSLSGVYGTVESVIIENTTQTMYDITVEEVHTFAVGEGDWVVHNECDQEIADLAVSNARVYAEQITNGTVNTGRNRAGATTVVVDYETGEVLGYGFSGNAPGREDYIYDVMPDFIRQSQYEGTRPRPPHICGEPHACANIISDGGDLSRGVVVTITTSTGEIKPPCRNCASWVFDTFYGVAMEDGTIHRNRSSNP